MVFPEGACFPRLKKKIVRILVGWMIFLMHWIFSVPLNCSVEEFWSNKTWQRARNQAFQKSNVWFENETMWKMKFILRGFPLHRYDIIETRNLMCRKLYVFCKRSTSELMYIIYYRYCVCAGIRSSIWY